ncbi:MAG TPA: hypothetical protein VF986_04455, partial [Actinomycetota bacterium]
MDERDREDNRLREWGFAGVSTPDPAAEAARRRADELAAERARQQAAEAMQGAMTRDQGAAAPARPTAKRATRKA